MPGVEGGGFLGSAIRAAQEGVSANRWLKALADAGTGIRRAVGLKLYAEAKGIAAEAGTEPTRALHQVPLPGEMRPHPTRGTAGVLQTVRLVYRERVTGKLVTRFHSTVSPEGYTRQEAIQAAIEAYAAHSEEYQNDLVGAVHTSAVRLVPVTLG